MISPDFPVPVKARLYTHQHNAFMFACENFGLTGKPPASNGTAFLMEMGTGKTLTSIAVAGTLYQLGRVEKILIVAPLSILGVWEEEFLRFADFPYSLTIVSGTAAQKQACIEKATKGQGLQILVANYETVWRLISPLAKFNADLVIADEGHKIKDSHTKQSKAMHTLGDKATYKLLLTGTVITNKELDVFSQYRFLDSRIFGRSFYTFRNRYFYMTGYGGYTPVFRDTMLPEFLSRMHSVAFRVTKDECLDLPEISEEKRYIELEDSAKKLYRRVAKDGIAKLENSEVTAVNILTQMLRLSQITGGHITDDEHDTDSVSTAKLNALSDIIDAAMEENKKLVVIARFTPEIKDIQALLEKKKIGYAAVHGAVKNREEEIKRFQEDPDCKVFIGQIAAAGLGITLTAASTMVFYSLDYSMSNFEQAKARIHRVSQKNNCHYIYLIAKGTIDEKVLKALQSKFNLAKTLVDDYRNGINPF